MAELSRFVSMECSHVYSQFCDEIGNRQEGDKRLSEFLAEGGNKQEIYSVREELEARAPHALYPTSPYRESNGSIVGSADDHSIEAVMSFQTYTSIRFVDGVLSTENVTLRDIYKPLKRCICLVDRNVEEHFGSDIDGYFFEHNIDLHKLVYRAMEVDKNLSSVERILSEFKDLGVARHEPVLIIGGGVLADIGGLACALFNRNTPYVMLGTSIVSSIDAGPSPRTCSDGFGYKNLSGAYHAPILTLTDRAFFKTLKIGWLRHGIAEIIKMAVVRDEELFSKLELAGPELIYSRFATDAAESGSNIDTLSKEILASAMRSYVEAEYGNLYETHQCRPHAYGHTWSPGFELQAGLLHGHAISIGMGLGGFLSWKKQWLDEQSLVRILNLFSTFELTLWHEILLDERLLWKAQVSITEKRGGNLSAPVPKGRIGQCGYINELDRAELASAVVEYGEYCRKFPRGGLGIEPLCEDVGLESPLEMAYSNKPTIAA